jgi:hypothetical protein
MALFSLAKFAVDAHHHKSETEFRKRGDDYDWEISNQKFATRLAGPIERELPMR